MRPLFHPAIREVRLEAILHALSDPNRVAIFVRIAGAAHSQSCTAAACFTDRVIPKSSLSLHFKILREAGLIRSERHGVEIRNVSRWEEIEVRFPGLIPAIVNAYIRSAH